MQPNDAPIAVLTVTYNSAAVLPDFLRSLARQAGAEWHLFAVDNASSDSTVEQLRAFEAEHPDRVSVTGNVHNTGAAEGNNIAIRAALAAGFELLLFVNNDVLFPPDLLT